jgi:hypothetical protein
MLIYRSDGSLGRNRAGCLAAAIASNELTSPNRAARTDRSVPFHSCSSYSNSLANCLRNTYRCCCCLNTASRSPLTHNIPPPPPLALSSADEGAQRHWRGHKSCRWAASLHLSDGQKVTNDDDKPALVRSTIGRPASWNGRHARQTPLAYLL